MNDFLRSYYLYKYCTFQLLVEEGASLETQDEGGDTPLHEAVRFHTLLLLKELQMKGAEAVCFGNIISINTFFFFLFHGMLN